MDGYGLRGPERNGLMERTRLESQGQREIRQTPTKANNKKTDEMQGDQSEKIKRQKDSRRFLSATFPAYLRDDA